MSSAGSAYPVTAAEAIALAVAGCAAGAVNVIVGSGSLLTFPTLVAIGVPPLLANVSNNVGVIPGSLVGTVAYRRELQGQRQRVIRLAPLSLVGGALGAGALLLLPTGVFAKVVPVLVVVATLLMAAQPALSRRLGHGSSERLERWPVLLILVFATGLYGGYFGAAQGVILISLLATLVTDSLQRLNALKNLLALLANLSAAAVFVGFTRIDWAAAGILAAGSLVGGRVGALVGRRLATAILRRVVVAVGLAAATYLFLKYF